MIKSFQKIVNINMMESNLREQIFDQNLLKFIDNFHQIQFRVFPINLEQFINILNSKEISTPQ